MTMESPNTSSSGTAGQKRPALNVGRFFTKPDTDPLDAVRYTKRASQIKDPDGTIVFELKDVEVPETWSQLATDIIVSKYFRKGGVPGVGHETSVKQVIRRVARTIRAYGVAAGYFETLNEGLAFEAELSHLLVHQYGAFNSPVWFNVGLHAEYGISNVGETFRYDPATKTVAVVGNSYEYPQSSACFIQPVKDDLMAIFELVKNEARVFKYGSGTGSNFDRIRGRLEKLSGGGTSSGLMSWLKVLDSGAGSIKSGGTTRRAATMRCLSMDHPEIVEFIQWKTHEEQKARALIAQGYPADFNGEAYQTVSGQNSNNSVRVSDAFMRAVIADEDWKLTARTTGEVLKTYKARELWDMIAVAAWECADPGVQYDTTINDWHTCANTDRIYASNPCSEYMFLDDSACNLASLNLTKFLRSDDTFDVDAFRVAVRVFFIAQEILVGLSAYPTPGIAENSYKYRPLGLGYANLGTLLMSLGLPYDSDEGRTYAACITALMHCHAGRVSAELAARMGPFEMYTHNQSSMLAVMRKHVEAALHIPAGYAPESLRAAVYEDARDMFDFGMKYGYRNAQFTLLAPTGTIGFLMDCDTTGIEPDFALVKHKKLAGGGYFKITNASVCRALVKLGYAIDSINRILTYMQGTLKFDAALTQQLSAAGMTAAEILAAEARLPGAFTLDMALGTKDVLARFGLAPGASVLKHIGISDADIATATKVILGHGTLEGAPGFDPEHLPVFACASRCGDGTQLIAPRAHLHMMAAVQPHLSGAISKTCNVPNEATVQDIKDLYFEGWKLGLKAVAIYRDGCKSSQPLSSASTTQPSTAQKPVAALSLAEAQDAVAQLHEQHGPRVFAKTTPPVVRQRLPKNRAGSTQEATVGGTKIFLRTGEYHDGRVGEIFLDMHKEGAAFRAMANSFAIAVSMGLQHGVPLEEFVDQFTFVRFEPHGPVQDDANIKHATSVLDYVFRHLGVNYLGRTDLSHIQPPTPVRFGGRVLVAPGEVPIARAEAAVATGNPVQYEPPYEAPELAPELAVAKKSGAPFCDSCGHQTVRNATCWRCLNCGSSMGCS